ncbi:hypothetical protein NC797_00925 [Aquibacillus sp. 3ASR75-11]|uniref:Uncharacterized protein n=1 Tax=Terrihalobacillus insolitus TaxID=2950438 RepID=A0A9X4AM20_9BACI|nr:hypothetical protein [Terrihalobacillus insolitus]MDC3412238.1 hypothetical protein [Terrihalobacillus insolitus]MDC3423068.1 hypothetical protein [Terrihalobacillus insolitus]
MSCLHCKVIQKRLDQQEHAISQLLTILATTNRKLVDLENTHIKNEILHQHSPRFFVASSSSDVSSKYSPYK